MEVEKWSARFNKVVDLFNDGQFSVAAKEARVLLKGPEIPDYYHIRCLILLARSTTELWEVQISYDCAKYIWTDMRSRWPAETTNSRGKQIMNKLRCMLNELSADKLAIWPENTDYIPGLGKGQAHLAEGNEDIPPDVEEGDIFVEDAERLGQKEEETALIRSDNVEAEIDDDYLTLFPFNNNNNDSNRESVSTEQSLMFNDADKSKRSSFPLSSTGDFESPLERQQTPFSFTPIRVVPDSTYHFASASRLRQKDAATSPTPGQSENKKAAISSPSVSQPRQVQDRNITLPGPSIPPIKEKEDTKVDKPKMIPRDVSDEPNPNKGVTGGKGKNMHITEILRSDPHQEALKSRPTSPTKVRHSVSVKSSPPRTASSSHSASAPQQAEDVSAQAEDSRSSSTSVLDADQVELPHPSSALLPEDSKNVEPSRQDPQAEKEAHRSSARGVFKRSVNSLKNLKNSTIGKVVTHNRRRRPTAESSLKAVLKTDNKKRAAARRDKENKKQKSSQKKLTGDLASNSSRSGRSGQRPSMRCSMSCSLSCSM